MNKCRVFFSLYYIRFALNFESVYNLNLYYLPNYIYFLISRYNEFEDFTLTEKSMGSDVSSNKNRSLQGIYLLGWSIFSCHTRWRMIRL